MEEAMADLGPAWARPSVKHEAGPALTGGGARRKRPFLSVPEGPKPLSGG